MLDIVQVFLIHKGIDNMFSTETASYPQLKFEV
jgi:hypothetical protein